MQYVLETNGSKMLKIKTCSFLHPAKCPLSQGKYFQLFKMSTRYKKKTLPWHSIIQFYLKLNIKTKKPLRSWHLVLSLHGKQKGKQVETVTDFIFLVSKIIADGDCSHKIKRHLFLGRKAMMSQASVLKSRDITLQTKVHIVKVMVFPVVMYQCESWTIKKTKC